MWALAERMEKRLGGRQAVQALRITHAAWFPEVDWNGPLPGTDVPSRAFLFDRQSLKDPLAALQKLAREAFAAARSALKFAMTQDSRHAISTTPSSSVRTAPMDSRA